MIGSLARDSAQMNSASDEADEDEPADGRIGPLAGLLVGQADQQERRWRP